MSSVAVQKALEDAVAMNGHVDVLVNCAGITHTATMLDTPSQKYEVSVCISVGIQLVLSKLL